MSTFAQFCLKSKGNIQSVTSVRHKQAYTFAKQAVKKLKVVIDDGVIYTGISK